MKNYLAEPSFCPFCGNWYVEQTVPSYPYNDIAETEIRRICRCDKCGRKWFDIYKLDRVLEEVE